MSETVEQKPFELTLGDGTVVKASNMDDAFKVLAKMKEDTAAALRDAKAQVATLQSERDQYAQQAESARLERERRESITTHNGFSKDQYYKLLNEDPMIAQDYLDAYRFDLPQEQVRPTFIGVRQQVDALTQQAVTASFLSQHAEDYPSGDAAAAKALVGRVQQLVSSGLPVTVDTMNYAYTQLVNEGTVKPLEAAKDDSPDIAPSTSGGGRTSVDDDISKIENMSDKDLAALMRSKGMMV